MKRHLRSILALLILLTIAAGATVAFGYYKYTSPTQNPAQVILIAKGASLNKTAADLRQKSLIATPFWFKFFARIQGKEKDLKSGEYQIPANASAKNITDIIISGATIVHKITFKEGLTSSDVVKELNATNNLSGEVESIPENGTLLPETYHYSYGDSRQDIISRMQKVFATEAEKLWKNSKVKAPLESFAKAKVLASLIEREAVTAAERPIIASVFINRLKKGMKLQSDPTVIFSVTGGNFDLDRPLVYKDLEIDSPFNTYKYKGLPPKPICNFGLDSLRAALSPATTDYLYFVVNPESPTEHLFAKTYEEHQQNTAKFLKFKRAERKKLRREKSSAKPRI